MFATMISAVPSPKSAKAKSAINSHPKGPGDTPMDGNDETLSLDDTPMDGNDENLSLEEGLIEWVKSERNSNSARYVGPAKI